MHGRRNQTGRHSALVFRRLFRMPARLPRLSRLCAAFVMTAVENAMEMSTIEDCGELFAWVEAHLSGGLVRCCAPCTC